MPKKRWFMPRLTWLIIIGIVSLVFALFVVLNKESSLVGTGHSADGTEFSVFKNNDQISIAWEDNAPVVVIEHDSVKWANFKIADCDHNGSDDIMVLVPSADSVAEDLQILVFYSNESFYPDDNGSLKPPDEFLYDFVLFYEQDGTPVEDYPIYDEFSFCAGLFGLKSYSEIYQKPKTPEYNQGFLFKRFYR